MANYANAKATIAANIYTNHRGEVTAEMVKTAADEIVNTLIVGGYLYAGIAKLTPTQTNPGSPDANVFYIATEPGTYTHFVGAGGSLVVADGEVAIFKWNGIWSKEVTGAATAAQVTELGQNLENPEFVRVVVDINGKILYGVKENGDFYFGAGVPSQILNALLGKVDKVAGKTLIDEEIASLQSIIVNSEYVYAVVDGNNKILFGVRVDGTYVIGGDVDFLSGLPQSIKEYINTLMPNVPSLKEMQMFNHKDMFDIESLDWLRNVILEDKYWPQEQSYVEAFISKFTARAGSGKYQIAVISDTHGSGAYTFSKTNALSPGTSNLRSIAVFNKIMENCDAGLHGGDISCDYGTSRLRILEYMSMVLYQFKFSSRPFFITKGNHDVNNNTYVEVNLLNLDWRNTQYYKRARSVFTPIIEAEWNGGDVYEQKTELVSDQEFRNIAQHWQCPINAVWGDGAYYYYDIDSIKVRFIVGNSFPVTDSYENGDTAEYLWMAQTALNLSEKASSSEWSVLMLRHTQATGLTDLANCINAFRNGGIWTYGENTVDFGEMNGGGMKFIAHIHGHEHHYCFSNGAGFFDIGETISCTGNLGTPADYGLSVWTIDTINKKVIEDTISGKTWVYNYNSGRLELHRGDTFTCAESGLKRTVVASCSEPTITISNNMDVTIGNDTPYGDYTIVVTGANGNTLNYLISVVE